MENKTLGDMLKTLGLPIAYREFKKRTPLPNIVFFQRSSNNFGADNIVYQSDNDYAIELYTCDKDIALEEQLEALFEENEIYWIRLGDERLEKEDMTVAVYYI